MDVVSEPLRYELLAKVGTGSYGEVFKARETDGKQRLLAVKKFFCGIQSNTGVPAVMIREVALLRRMTHFEHPNIVRLFEASIVPEDNGMSLMVVMEYIDQDLSTFMSEAPAPGLGRDCVKDVMWQLLQGLDFLHSQMVLHRDLKPENILVSSRREVKITDFGLARAYSINMALTPDVVTLWYRAPEVLLNCTYSSAVDVWSAGCVFAELLLQRPLFKGYTEVQQLQKIFEVIGLPDEEDWPPDGALPYLHSWGPGGSCSLLLLDLEPEERNLLTQCLTFSPQRRISAHAALDHPFFMAP